MCHRWNEIFFYKVVFIGLSTFSFLQWVVRAETPQRKPAMPPRGLATNCNAGRDARKRRKGQEKTTNYSKSFHRQELPTGQRTARSPTWSEREEAGTEPTPDGTATPQRLKEQVTELP